MTGVLRVDGSVEFIRLNSDELNTELGITSQVFNPEDDAMCKQIAFIELVAAAGRTVQVAAQYCQLTPQQVLVYFM
jgi:hypothetical protein